MALDLDTHIRSESARFAEVLAGVDADARVPGNPGWSAADLLWHLTEVHSIWATIVRERLDDPAPADAAVPDRPEAYADLLALYDRTTAELVEALDDTADDVPVWTWSADQNVGFVRHFQAHEALIHRVDAELTAGTLTALPSALAADGVEVVLRYSKAWRPGWASWSRTGAVGELQATDTGDRCRVALGVWGGSSPDTGKTYADEPALELLDLDAADEVEPTFSVSAPASDLDAWLWHRPGFGEVSVAGERADFDAFAALIAKGVE